jgi:hypothetical protein
MIGWTGLPAQTRDELPKQRRYQGSGDLSPEMEEQMRAYRDWELKRKQRRKHALQKRT